MAITEPISRRLLHFGRVYQNLLTKQVGHLDADRHHDVVALIYAYKGTLTQKMLGKIIGKDKSAMVNIIDLLTQKGYVYRQINPADRREQLLKTTEKAEREVPQMMRAVEAVNTISTENIADAELDTFNKVLAMMEANLATAKKSKVLPTAKPNTIELI